MATVLNLVLAWIVLVTTALIQPGTPPPCTDLRLFFILGGGCAHKFFILHDEQSEVK